MQMWVRRSLKQQSTKPDLSAAVVGNDWQKRLSAFIGFGCRQIWWAMEDMVRSLGFTLLTGSSEIMNWGGMG
jgi:hypothetical protein